MAILVPLIKAQIPLWCYWLANAILTTFVYANGQHSNSGRMHTVLHSNGTVIEEKHWKECPKRASKYAKVTRKTDGSLNIKNQSNFGVQTPGPVIYNLPLDQKPVTLISHALGAGKAIDAGLVVVTANHAQGHPLYCG